MSNTTVYLYLYMIYKLHTDCIYRLYNTVYMYMCIWYTVHMYLIYGYRSFYDMIRSRLSSIQIGYDGETVRNTVILGIYHLFFHKIFSYNFEKNIFSYNHEKIIFSHNWKIIWKNNLFSIIYEKNLSLIIWANNLFACCMLIKKCIVDFKQNEE